MITIQMYHHYQKNQPSQMFQMFPHFQRYPHFQ
jgi:hypothetical protein